MEPEHFGDGASHYGMPGVCLWMGGVGEHRKPEQPAQGVERARKSLEVIYFLFLPGMLLRVLLSLPRLLLHGFLPQDPAWMS